MPLGFVLGFPCVDARFRIRKGLKLVCFGKSEEFRESAFGDRGRGVGNDDDEGDEEESRVTASTPAKKRVWFPEGLLRDILQEKEREMEEMETAISARPDHPLSLRLGFIADEVSMSLARALQRTDGSVGVVAQFKRCQLPRSIDEEAEPIAGVGDLYEKSLELQACGIDAMLIETDARRYGCSLGDFENFSKRMARGGRKPGSKGVAPLIRRDMIFHPIQLAEAAELGANAVVLVASFCLPDLENLLNSASLMGLETIVECHNELERDYALQCGATILSLTNVDFSTNQLKPGRAIALRPDVPDWIITIASGGIRTASDAWAYLDAGFDAVTMGTTWMQTRRAPSLIGEIRSHKRDLSRRFFENFGFDPSDEDRIRNLQI